MTQIESSKLVGYAVLDADDASAQASKLVGYAVLDADDASAQASKLVGYAVLDVIRPEISVSKLAGYAVMDLPLVVGMLLDSDVEWLYADQIERQWLRDGEPIEDAVGETYTVAIEDVGAVISLQVKARNRAGVVIHVSNELGPFQ
jgi:hypothetical protein